MAELWRVRCTWTGSGVTGPAVSTFHFLPETAGMIAGLKAFFQQASNYVTMAADVTVPSEGEIIDVATGQLAGAWQQAGGATIDGQGTQAHAQGVGGRVVWRTGAVTNNRRVRGATFLVPLASNIYANDGTLEDAAVTGMKTGIGVALGDWDGGFVVWSHRPGTTTGSSAVVTSGDLADKVSWLRSRRT